MKIKKIEDVFTKHLRDKIKEKNEIKIEIMKTTIKIDETWKQTKKFEIQALNYLFEKGKEIGIEKIYKIENGRVDGAAILKDGSFILLEMKNGLSWSTSCVARIEVQRFIVEKFFEKFDSKLAPVRAIIVFKEFSSRDWKGNTKNPEFQDGWYHFYDEEKILRKESENLPTDIVQFKDGFFLESFSQNFEKK